jgi:hypothetical protein
MAEQQHYEFTAVDAKDILAEREQGWQSFTRFATWGSVAVVVILLGMLVFIA